MEFNICNDKKLYCSETSFSVMKKICTDELNIEILPGLFSPSTSCQLLRLGLALVQLIDLEWIMYHIIIFINITLVINILQLSHQSGSSLFS